MKNEKSWTSLEQSRMSLHPVENNGSYDLNVIKTMDRELKKQKIDGDNKDTIMTVNDAAYSSHRLEEMKVDA